MLEYLDSITSLRDDQELSQWRYCHLHVLINNQGAVYLNQRNILKNYPPMIAVAWRHWQIMRLVDVQGKQYVCDYSRYYVRKDLVFEIVEPEDNWPLEDFLISEKDP